MTAQSGSSLVHLVEELCTRRLDGVAYPTVHLATVHFKQRVDGRAGYQAVVVATGEADDGRLEILGVDVGDSERTAFWSEFLSILRLRGLGGVTRVLTDEEHGGLVRACATVFPGARPIVARKATVIDIESLLERGAAALRASALTGIPTSADDIPASGGSWGAADAPFPRFGPGQYPPRLRRRGGLHIDWDLARRLGAVKPRRSAASSYPIVFVHVAPLGARRSTHRRPVRAALVTVSGASDERAREPLTAAVGDSESRGFWDEFFHRLVDRGVRDVHTVVSEPHAGLERALADVLPDARWRSVRAWRDRVRE